MQSGHRSLNSPANPFSDRPRRHRLHHQAAFEPDGSDVRGAPVSAARLAAEAAFADPPPRPAPSSPAQVIVRRARLVAPVDQTPGADTHIPASLPLDRGPRVFRVEAAPAPAFAASLDKVEPLSLAPSPAPDGSAGAVGAVVRRPRRTAPDKRPGPVLHVVHTLPARPRPIEAQASDLSGLIAALARVDPVLAAIERAQSFRVIDDRYAAQWQRLSLQAEAIRAELKTQERWIDRPEAYKGT